MDFIAERRANKASYRRIAAELRDATNGQVNVSDVTVRSWLLAAEDAAA